MSLDFIVNAEPDVLARITAVARRASCPVFVDILWPPCPEVSALMVDPGVMFESSHRIVVLQWIGEELRYYAGGWCPNQSRIRLEQERVWAEGGESGVFASVADALAFAERYLVEERSFATVEVPQEVRYSRLPERVSDVPHNGSIINELVRP